MHAFPNVSTHMDNTEASTYRPVGMTPECTCRDPWHRRRSWVPLRVPAVAVQAAAGAAAAGWEVPAVGTDSEVEPVAAAVGTGSVAEAKGTAVGMGTAAVVVGTVVGTGLAAEVVGTVATGMAAVGMVGTAATGTAAELCAKAQSKTAHR